MDYIINLSDTLHIQDAITTQTIFERIMHDIILAVSTLFS